MYDESALVGEPKDIRYDFGESLSWEIRTDLVDILPVEIEAWGEH